MGSFVIVYKGQGSPSDSEEREVLSALARKSARVVDQMPGTIMVEGSESEVASALRGRSSWRLSPAGSVDVAPHRRSFRLR
jgi:hypothetical protein